jgi:hypothetical protein
MLERTYVFAEGKWQQWNDETMTFCRFVEGVQDQDRILFEFKGNYYYSDLKGE